MNHTDADIIIIVKIVSFINGMNILLNQSAAFSDSRQLVLHSDNDQSFNYPVTSSVLKQNSGLATLEKPKHAGPNEARIDRVLAEFGLPVGAQIDPEIKRSMRSCREKGYEKGRAILANIGREILESKT